MALFLTDKGFSTVHAAVCLLTQLESWSCWLETRLTKCDSGTSLQMLNAAILKRGCIADLSGPSFWESSWLIMSFFGDWTHLQIFCKGRRTSISLVPLACEGVVMLSFLDFRNALQWTEGGHTLFNCAERPLVILVICCDLNPYFPASACHQTTGLSDVVTLVSSHKATTEFFLSASCASNLCFANATDITQRNKT